MEVLASRLILHPSDMAQSRHFYEQVLGCESSMSMATAARSAA
jgi:extradiol dioxygenase family protein